MIEMKGLSVQNRKTIDMNGRRELRDQNELIEQRDWTNLNVQKGLILGVLMSFMIELTEMGKFLTLLLVLIQYTTFFKKNKCYRI